MRAVIATTHLDANGALLTKEALEAMAARDAGRLFPISQNFDLRVPPVGHVTILPGVEQLPDGCWALYGEVELLPDAVAHGIAIGYIVEPPTLHNVSETPAPSDLHCFLPQEN